MIRIIYIVELKFSVIGTIIDFPYSHILQQNLQNFFNHIKPRLSHEQLNDWVIEFHINPTNIYWLETQEYSKSFLGVYKRGITYPKIKRKIFSVIIPIPNSNQISWGLPEERYLHRPKANPNNFFLTEFSTKGFTDLEDYFLESAKEAISIFLNKGFKIQGINLKFDIVDVRKEK